MVVSFFVPFDPSPYEFLFALTFIAFAFELRISAVRPGLPLFVLGLILYVIANMTFVITSKDLAATVFHLLATIFLALTFLVIVIVGKDDRLFIRRVLHLYCWASFFAALAVILGAYTVFSGQSLLGVADYLIFEDGLRPTGFFEDPNVAGAFIGLGPALLAALTYSKYQKLNVPSVLLMVTMMIGVILTASRVALVIVLVTTCFAIWSVLQTAVRRTVFVFFAAGGIGLAFFAVVNYYDAILSGLSYLDRLADLSQSVDVRIMRMRSGLVELAQSPVNFLFGIGHVVDDGHLPHDTYLLTMVRSGLIGFLGLSLFIVSVLVFSWRSTAYFDDRYIYAVVIVYLCLVFASGAIISVLHWRHVWLLLGCMGAASLLPKDERISNRLELA